MYSYRMESTPLSSLIAATLSWEAKTRMTRLFRQNGELYVQYSAHTPMVILKIADRSSSVVFFTASGFQG